MKKFFYTPFRLLLVALAVFSVSSCQKTAQSPTRTSGTVNSAAFASSQAIVLTASATDTIFAVNTCEHGDKADTVAFSTLPDTVVTYLAANYSGYTPRVAYKILDHSGNLAGYVVAITYNGSPVGVAFNAGGIFVKVLEQREGADLHTDKGWHEGGRFGDRDGKHRDTIALSALPAAITAYFTTNYPKDTLKHALTNWDNSYLVVSTDRGVFVTEFTSTGTFIKRVQVYPHVVTRTSLTQTNLPAAISTCLTTTYPAYVFDAAYTVNLNSVLEGYIVFIDANTTKYLVRFDASGTFVKAIAIR